MGKKCSFPIWSCKLLAKDPVSVQKSLLSRLKKCFPKPNSYLEKQSPETKHWQVSISSSKPQVQTISQLLDVKPENTVLEPGVVWKTLRITTSALYRAASSSSVWPWPSWVLTPSSEVTWQGNPNRCRGEEFPLSCLVTGLQLCHTHQLCRHL